MDRPCLNDKDEYPDIDVLTRHLGKTIAVWNSFMELLSLDFPSFATEWRYYNDGKSWLCKVTKKKKTICWISIWRGFFRVSSYFTAKADAMIAESSLDDRIKQHYFQSEVKGKIKPVRIEIEKVKDLNSVRELLKLKEKIK